MSNVTRREKIESLLEGNPGDQFLRYCLAMELVKEGALERSLELFRGLMSDTPAHVPSFHMAARQLVQAGRTREARETLCQGIELARGSGETHAAGEMGELLASLGELGE